ncbi:Uncharacterized protein OBRU01_04354 [Operophtera brumata]|uniref:Zasp-like motif domain-containing protein n=1 Tax=Operophtera brumata TaxID=104452 RepID=A0A0L7LJ40_OPEBR|nr:Uncharacterized protein OBRU01_04354 [Operophtera brumata]
MFTYESITEKHVLIESSQKTLNITGEFAAPAQIVGGQILRRPQSESGTQAARTKRRTSAETNEPKMATGPKIVHKQFNSPIGLYSQRNIQDTLSKHLQNLDNGTVGIDFSNPATDKPGNLANSAVLRMLEEENQNRRGKLDPTQVQAILDNMVRVNKRFDEHWPPETATHSYKWSGQRIVSESKGPKKVVWPPTPETNGYHSQQQNPAFYNSAQDSPQQQSQPQAQYQPEHQAQPQYQPQAQPQYQQPQYQQPQYQQPQYQQPQYQPPQNQPQYYPESQPSYCEGKKQQPTGLSKLIPFGPGVTASRQGPPSPGVAPAYRQGPPSPGVVPQPYRAQPNRWAPVPAPLSPQPQNTQQSYPQQYSPQPQQYSPQAYSEPAYQPPQRQFEPPPSTITLRQKQPVKKDYSSFFAQNALNQNYPGYRAPPGTQHYEELSGRSSY